MHIGGRGPVLPVLAALAISIAFFVDIQWSTPAARMLFVPFMLTVAGGVASQYYRYRYVSTPTERQQTKWMIVGFVFILIGMLAWVIPLEVLVIGPSEVRLLYFIGLMAAWVLLWSFFMTLLAIAILKYRLWDIDVLINRALVYGLLTASLAASYLAGVVVLQGLFRGLTGQEIGLGGCRIDPHRRGAFRSAATACPGPDRQALLSEKVRRRADAIGFRRDRPGRSQSREAVRRPGRGRQRYDAANTHFTVAA